ncbi:hypothetical protein C0991_011746, partial [Blastosporella zonata]
MAEELSAAQTALEEARREILQRSQDSTRLVNLCERIEEQRANDEEEHVRRAMEEGERTRDEYERVTELQGEVERLKKALVEKAGRLRERYGRNELNDDEMDFVEGLMSLAMALHEEKEVAKANELRR